MNRFVSKGAVQGETELVTDAGASNGNAESLVEASVPQDNRTLYEKLQSNRLKAEEEFAEKTKLSNLIKKLDTDEIEFLSNQQDLKRQRRMQQEQEDKEEVRQFAVKAAALQPAADDPSAHETVLVQKAKSVAAFSANLKSKKKAPVSVRGKTLEVQEEQRCAKPSLKRKLVTTTKEATKNVAPGISLVSGYSSDSGSGEA